MFSNKGKKRKGELCLFRLMVTGNPVFLCQALCHLQHGMWQACSRLSASDGSRDGRFGSKVGQIGPKWDKSGFFQIRFHCIWPNAQKSDLKKPRTNLTHFGATPSTPVPGSQFPKDSLMLQYVARLSTKSFSWH